MDEYTAMLEYECRFNEEATQEREAMAYYEGQEDTMDDFDNCSEYVIILKNDYGKDNPKMITLREVMKLLEEKKHAMS